jgi:hypothetical protein
VKLLIVQTYDQIRVQSIKCVGFEISWELDKLMEVDNSRTVVFRMPYRLLRLVSDSISTISSTNIMFIILHHSVIMGLSYIAFFSAGILLHKHTRHDYLND